MVPADARAEVVLLRDGAEVASWSLLCEGRADLRAVEEVARLQLQAGRQGCSIWLRHACPDLVALLELVGLAGVMRVGRPAREAGPETSLALQVGREAEGLEERGVEEVVVPDDPVA